MTYATPLVKPDLPTLEQISPYLADSYNSDTFSNFGPAAVRFQDQVVSQMFPSFYALTACNATLAIQAVLHSLSFKLRPGSRIAIPGYTFAATACAVIAAGHVPVFIDIISLELPFMNLSQVPKDISAIIAVSSLGIRWPVGFSGQSHTAPTILDSAAAFGAGPGRPLCRYEIFSLHATKSFGIGEGAVIVSGNDMTAVKQALNFGFSSDGKSQIVGTNGKMSEFSAAVALAQMPRHQKILNDRRAVLQTYHTELSGANVIMPTSVHPIDSTAPQIFPVVLPTITARNNLISRLEELRIQSRVYYQPLYKMPAFSKYEVVGNTNTEDLSNRILCLPCYPSAPGTNYQEQVIGAIRSAV